MLRLSQEPQMLPEAETIEQALAAYPHVPMWGHGGTLGPHNASSIGSTIFWKKSLGVVVLVVYYQSRARVGHGEPSIRIWTEREFIDMVNKDMHDLFVGEKSPYKKGLMTNILRLLDSPSINDAYVRVRD